MVFMDAETQTLILPHSSLKNCSECEIIRCAACFKSCDKFCIGLRIQSFKDIQLFVFISLACLAGT